MKSLAYFGNSKSIPSQCHIVYNVHVQVKAETGTALALNRLEVGLTGFQFDDFASIPDENMITYMNSNDDGFLSDRVLTHLPLDR